MADAIPLDLPNDRARKKRLLRRMSEIDDILSLLYPELKKPLKKCDVLDLGCGKGFLSIPIALRVHGLRGIEMNPARVEAANRWAEIEGLKNTEFLVGSILDLEETESYDIVICSDVLEHIKEQEKVMATIVSSLRPGGVFYLTTNNKLWPFEGHHRLPFLSYLPRKWANGYVRLTKRGSHFRIYPLTYWQLRSLLDRFPITYAFKPPRNPKHFLHKIGKKMVEASQFFWNFANAFQVIGTRRE